MLNAILWLLGIVTNDESKSSNNDVCELSIENQHVKQLFQNITSVHYFLRNLKMCVLVKQRDKFNSN